MTATRPGRVPALVIGGLIAAVLTLGFAMHIGLRTLGRVDRIEHRVLHGPLAALQLDAAEGDVLVVAGPGPDVTIDSRAEGTLRVPRLHTTVAGSQVQVSGGCPRFSIGPCRTRIVVHVPPSLSVQVRAHSGDVSAAALSGSVQLRTSSGDVSAEELSGGAALRTSSGDVDASGLSGTVSLQSSSGDVAGHDMRSRTVTALTNSGDLSLEFEATPVHVEATGHAGDVHVIVPPGGPPYGVDAETAVGSRDVTVATASTADRTMRLRTDSGDIRVEYGNAVP
jgi:hypothetical protein